MRHARPHGLAIVAAVLAVAAPAGAHPGHEAEHAERLLRLELDVRPPRLVYSLALGADAIAAERDAADTNHDGAVSSNEAPAALDRLATGVAASIIACSGATLDVAGCRALAPGDLERASASAWDAASGRAIVTFTYRLPARAGDAALRVIDRSKRADVDHTDAVIVPPRDAPLVRAGRADATGVATDLHWDDGAAERELIAVWAAPSSLSARTLAILAGIALALAATFASTRARARPARGRAST